jgi:hypothetical protein
LLTKLNHVKALFDLTWLNPRSITPIFKVRVKPFKLGFFCQRTYAFWILSLKLQVTIGVRISGLQGKKHDKD